MVSHANAITDRIVSSVGQQVIHTIFVAGSLARGEVASVATPEGLDIYSDIDLYVVVADGATSGSIAAKVAGALDDAASPQGVRFMRPHDAGVYTSDELLAQPLRPGTDTLATSHILLYGDDLLLARLGERNEGTIPPSEGLYLIENRLTELAQMRNAEDPDALRLLRFYRAKTVIDVAGACTLAAGSYRAGTDECVSGFMALSEPLSGDDSERRLVRRAGDALSNLATTVEDGGSGLADADVARMAVNAWHRIARTIYDHKTARAGKLIHRRCHIGDYTHNFRQFVAMQRRVGASRMTAALSGVHLTRFAPLDSLRMASLIECVLQQPDVTGATRDALGSVRGFLDKLTSVCGYQSGTTAERARAMFREVA